MRDRHRHGGFIRSPDFALMSARRRGVAALTVAIRSSDGVVAQVSIPASTADGTTVPITISGQAKDHYNGSWAPTAGDLRAGAWHLDGTTLLTYPGLTEGEDVTSDDGLWATPTGTLTLSRVWRRDGSIIPGATGQSYTLTASDPGTSLRCDVTADDGENGTVTEVGMPMPIPAAGSYAVESVTFGALEGGSLPAVLGDDPPDIPNGVSVAVVLRPAAGGDDLASTSLTWPSALTMSLPRTIALQSCVLDITPAGGLLFTSDPFNVKTTKPVLTSPVATGGEGLISPQVTCDEANATAGAIVYAAASDTALTGQEIIDHASVVSANAADGVVSLPDVTGLDAGTRTIWFTCRDDFDNIADPVSASDTVTAAPAYAVVSAFSGFSLAEDVDIGGTLYDVYTSTSLAPSITFSDAGLIDLLLVGGGGGGGGSSARAGGGGGGGQVLESQPSVTASVYNPTVGAGGASSGTAASDGGTGGTTTFDGVSALGGGGGGQQINGGVAAPNPGGAGSQSGANTASTDGGFQGGAGSVTGNHLTAGGGGASDLDQGDDGIEGDIGSAEGGAGVSSSITGSAVVYGAGGKGGIKNNNGGSAGIDGLGQGAEGANSSFNTGIGAKGGDGVIIIRVEAA